MCRDNCLSLAARRKTILRWYYKMPDWFFTYKRSLAQICKASTLATLLQAAYCLRRLFYKVAGALIPLRLLFQNRSRSLENALTTLRLAVGFLRVATTAPYWHLFCSVNPRRSKLHIACSDFFTKVRAHSRRCSSFPNHNRCAGLWFGIAASRRFLIL